MGVVLQPEESRAAPFLVRGNQKVATNPSPYQSGNGNGNGKVRNTLMTAGIVLSLLTSSGSLVKSIFYAGGNEARIEEHLKYVDQRLDSQDRRMEHDEERTEPIIDSLRDTVRKDRENADRQGELLDEMYSKMRTGR